MNRCNQSGRSMIEMLGVLAIIGVLSVGGFSLVSKVQENQRINEVIDNITSLAYKVRPVMRNYRNGDSTAFGYESLTQYLYASKAYPEGMEVEGVNFVDRNNVKYRVLGVNGEDARARMIYVILITGITEKMCLQLATANYGSKASTGYVGMQISDSFTTNSLPTLTGQRTLSEAINECNNENTYIQLGFR